MGVVRDGKVDAVKKIRPPCTVAKALKMCDLKGHMEVDADSAYQRQRLCKLGSTLYLWQPLKLSYLAEYSGSRILDFGMQQRVALSKLVTERRRKPPDDHFFFFID